MPRALAVLAILLSALLLGGCSMFAPSRLDEYQAEAERLTQETLDLIPAELDPEESFTDSRPNFPPSLTAGDQPSDSAWWEVYSIVTLIDAEGASRDAAEAISQGLTEDGWTKSHVRDTENGRRIADGYTLAVDEGRWYIEVTWVVSRPEMTETLELLVVSPTTTRGDYTPS